MMGTTFVTLDDERGFWMRDGILELWLRLLALHIEESPEPDFLGRRIRNEWLLASKGWFGGHLPHSLQKATATEEGLEIVRCAVRSLLNSIQNGPQSLDGQTLNLLGIEGQFTDSIDSARLAEVGQAFLDLLDGKIASDARSTEFMPGSSTAT